MLRFLGYNNYMRLLVVIANTTTLGEAMSSISAQSRNHQSGVPPIQWW
jgi:hypothetical protein